MLNKDIEEDNHIKDVINIYENKSSAMFQSIINGIDKHIYTNNLKNEIIENSSKKSILNILNKLYDNCEIVHLNHLKNDFIQNDNIDLFLINRLKKKSIMICNIDSEMNISSDNINGFYKIINQQKYNTIFLSQNSGFSLKLNYQIEYHNNNVVIFINSVNYDIDKIKVGINIIDTLILKIKDDSNNDYCISNSILEDINTDYKSLLNSKQSLINIIKDSHKQILQHLDNNIDINSLNSYLSNIFIKSNLNKNIFVCDLCNKYNGSNLKAIAAHKRGCKKKLMV